MHKKVHISQEAKDSPVRVMNHGGVIWQFHVDGGILQIHGIVDLKNSDKLILFLIIDIISTNKLKYSYTNGTTYYYQLPKYENKKVRIQF